MDHAIATWSASFAGGVMLLAAGADAASTQWQGLNQLTSLAEQTVREATPNDGHRRQFAAHGLDPRLRLRACESTPRAVLHNPGSRMRLTQTVAVSCDAPAPWTAYVRVTVEAYGEVVVARRPLARGQRVSQSDLYYEERRLDQLPYGWVENLEDVAGRPLRRAVAAGTVITPNALGTVHEIENGQEVLLKASTGTVDVGMAGKALQNGAIGERIRVRNLRSGLIVEGVVVSRRVVKVLTN
ncbi:MAG: flagellar basal body P-ring formation chaperone FlgA [Pseudomonadota bacterium]